jgi:hypothetical protein
MRSLAACVCFTAVGGLARLAPAGDVVMNWTEAYCDWSEGAATGDVPSNWHKPSSNGRVFLKDLNPGDHTFGISRAFGFGPLVVPNVRVTDDRATQLDMSFHTDYYAVPSKRKLKGAVIIQPFVARGDSIIKAAARFATLPEPRKVKYTILNAGPDGQPAGPTAIRPPSENAYIASWCHGQVPVTPGRVYCLRIEAGRGSQVEVQLSDSVSPMLPLIVDGKLVPDASLAGWVESDPPGIITTMACIEGKVNPKPDKEKCNGEFGQRFIARGTSLALVDVRPVVPGFGGEIAIDVIVRRGGPSGSGIGRQHMKGPNGSVLQAVWAPGEVETVAGEEYCVEFRNPAGGGLKMSRVAGELYPDGCLVMDDVDVFHLDLDMNIVEYARAKVAPRPPVSRTLSGDGVARIEYAIPQDPGIRKLQIRCRRGFHNERWPLSVAQDTLLSEIDVLPGQNGVFHHAGLANAQTYSYALFAVDLDGNFSPARIDSAFPGKGPVLPAQATLLNGNFASLEAMGARAANWDLRIRKGDPVCQAFHDADGVAFGWKAAEDTTASLMQTVTLHPGRRYELSAEARASGTAWAMIAPEGATGVEPSALTSEWKAIGTRFTAARPDTRVLLTGDTKAESAIQFHDVAIRDVTME